MLLPQVLTQGNLCRHTPFNRPLSQRLDPSDMLKLRIDMRTLVQTCMQRPEGLKFKGEPAQYALFRAE